MYLKHLFWTCCFYYIMVEVERWEWNIIENTTHHNTLVAKNVSLVGWSLWHLQNNWLLQTVIIVSGTTRMWWTAWTVCNQSVSGGVTFNQWSAYFGYGWYRWNSRLWKLQRHLWNKRKCRNSEFSCFIYYLFSHTNQGQPEPFNKWS